MRKIKENEPYNAYRGSHTVFRHSYDSSPAVEHAQFAVRRVHSGTPDEETQMETKLERVGKQRTTAQRMSICMKPAEAQEFALALCPEFGELLAAARKVLVLRDPKAKLPSDWSSDSIYGELAAALSKIATEGNA